MLPPDIRSESIIRRTNYRYGNNRNYTDTTWGHHLGCDGVDDQTAFDLVFGDRKTDFAEMEQAGATLFDARRVAEAFGGNGNQPYHIALAERHFKDPGDRERILRQHAVKRAALECRSERLVPQSATIFARPASASETNCLQNIAPRAQQVGWTDFPLAAASTAADISDRGYNIVSTTPSEGDGSFSQKTYERAAPSSIWGSQARDLSPRYPNFSGLFMTDKSEGRKIVLASNTIPRADLLDYGVYHFASGAISHRYSGIVIEDDTNEMRDKFDQKRQNLAEKANQTTQRTRDTSQRDLSRVDEKLARLAVKRAKLAGDRETAKAALRQHGMDTTQIDVAYDGQLNYLIQSENELKAERERLSSKSAPSSVSQTSTTVQTVSATTNASFERGLFKAFEDYRTVVILEGSPSSSCKTRHLVCADKLQAYNALGPRLNAAEYYQISPPNKYEPFDPTPR